MASSERLAGHRAAVLAARAATTAILPHETGYEPDHTAHDHKNLHTTSVLRTATAVLFYALEEGRFRSVDRV